MSRKVIGRCAQVLFVDGIKPFLPSLPIFWACQPSFPVGSQLGFDGTSRLVGEDLEKEKSLSSGRSTFAMEMMASIGLQTPCIDIDLINASRKRRIRAWRVSGVENSGFDIR